VRCEVPRLAGKTLKQTRSLLANANCTLGKVGRRYSAKRKGTVIAQSPRPGSNAKQNARVDVTLSKGRRPKKHPRTVQTAASASPLTVFVPHRKITPRPSWRLHAKARPA